MKTSSIWTESVAMPRYPALRKNIEVDVLVVGAGITGITAAYLFKQSGYQVALIDRAHCGGVDTSYTTAHLTQVTDLRLHQLAKTFGKDEARAIWEAGQAAIDRIVTNIRRENIRCEFGWLPGYLHARLGGESKKDRPTLEADAALARELGIRAEFVDSIPMFGLPGVRFDHQARFHPLKYLRALVRAIPGDGSYVFEETEMNGVESKPLRVTAGRYKIRCEYLVLATHNPLMGKLNLVSATLFQSKLALYTSYVVSARVPAGSVPEALYWDTNNPYHYLRVDPQRGSTIAIFGGKDHKTGQEPDTVNCFRALEATLLKYIPFAKVRHRWSGQIIETNDGLPLIGEIADQQFIATGFSGNGMTFGTLGAMMAVDAFAGRKNPWAELLSVRRKKFRGGTLDYLRENRDYPFYLVRDWLSRSEDKSLRTVRRNEGKILNLDGKKVAAYRDEDGNVTLRSPVCTHLGCIVGWNSAERTWDCPCHGSRFKPTGEVMSGPAEEDLKPM